MPKRSSACGPSCVRCSRTWASVRATRPSSRNTSARSPRRHLVRIQPIRHTRTHGHLAPPLVDLTLMRSVASALLFVAALFVNGCSHTTYVPVCSQHGGIKEINGPDHV